jgi:hypothetical protein
MRMAEIVSAMWLEMGNTIRVEFADGTVLFVPDDMTNRHRAELEEWLKVKSNTIQPYEPPPEAQLT